VARARAHTHTLDHGVALTTRMTTLPKSSDKWLPRRVVSTSTMRPYHHEAKATTGLSHRHHHPFTSVEAQHHHTVLVATVKVNNNTDKTIALAHGSEAQDMNTDARASTRSRWAK